MNMKNMSGKIAYTQFLHDGSELKVRENGDGSISFIIPGIKPDQTISVVEIFLK